MTSQSETWAALDLLKMLVLDPRYAALIAILVAAAWIDVKSHRIPNSLVFVGIVFAVLYNGLNPPYLRDNGWVLALSGLGIGFIAFLPFHMLKAMGAGDVKLMAMVGAFLGPWPTFEATLATGIAGGVLAIGFIFWTGRVRQAFHNVSLVMSSNLLTAPAGQLDFSLSPNSSAGKLPYGVAIATGTIAFLILRQLGCIH